MLETILLYVFGGTSVAGIVASLVFYKQNKKLKNNEVKSSDAEVEEKQINNDKAQIELGEKFLQSTLEMTEKMKQMMLESDKERDAYWKKQENAAKELHETVTLVANTVTKLEKDVMEIKEEQRTEIAFLNGDYKKFKEQMRQRLEDENKRPAEQESKKRGRPSRYSVSPAKKTTETKKTSTKKAEK